MVLNIRQIDVTTGNVIGFIDFEATTIAPLCLYLDGSSIPMTQDRRQKVGQTKTVQFYAKHF